MKDDREWRGCQLVNPLCPDDLCILPYGHGGQHMLTTMVQPGPVSDIMFMAPDTVKHRYEKLYEMGVEKARKLWPEQYR